MSKLRNEIINAFNLSEESDSKIIDECMELCRIYNKSPEDLMYKWDAMKFNSRANMHSEMQIPFDSSSIQQLKQEFQRNINAATKASAPRATRGAGFPQRASRLPPMAKQIYQKAPPAESDSHSSTVIFTRTDSNRPYRYMFEKISERSEILDDHLDDFSTLVREHYKLPELGDPNIVTDESMVVVGRITVDVESTVGPAKLNEAVIMLETPRMMGSGTRVPLRFDVQLSLRDGPSPHPGGIGFFPGAIAALRGKNGGAGWFQVEEILTLPPLAPTIVKTESDQSFSTYIASGPFTSDSDLEFKPWRKLLKVMQNVQPDVSILFGPFIDASHPRIKEGDLDKSPTQLFSDTFLEPLQDYLLTSPGRQVILIPSIRDAISSYYVFPQGPFGPEFSSHPKLHQASNPCRFALNGVEFAATSVDVLFHLRKEEFFKRTTDTPDPAADTMINLSRHLIQQRSFYPIFPSPGDLSHEVNLDVSHWDGLKLGGDCPRVMILPSRLKAFAKFMDNTLVINPGFLSKGSYGVLRFEGGVDNAKEQLHTSLVKLDE